MIEHRQLVLSSKAGKRFNQDASETFIDPLQYCDAKTELPFEDGVFDSVNFEQSFEIFVILRDEIKRVLKIGGELKIEATLPFRLQSCDVSSFWKSISPITESFELLDIHFYESTANKNSAVSLFNFQNNGEREGKLIARLKKRGYQPSVSIIIPMYNAGATIQECLQSLKRLQYPSDRFEVLVVDNGSTDNSIALAQEFGYTILSETQTHTSYAARNKGILAAQGELIAFTDSDCIVTPYWLNHLVKSWGDASIGCFAGEIKAYQPKTLVERFSERANLLGQIHTLQSSYLPFTQTANSAYRRDIFTHVGLFHPTMVSGGDADISWRMQKQLGLRIDFIPEALVYHKHRSSVYGLYKQFKRYEHGQIQLSERYSDYKKSTIIERKKEFEEMFEKAKKTFNVNYLKFLNDSIDIVAFVEPFLFSLIRYAAYSVRKKHGR